MPLDDLVVKNNHIDAEIDELEEMMKENEEIQKNIQNIVEDVKILSHEEVE